MDSVANLGSGNAQTRNIPITTNQKKTKCEEAIASTDKVHVQHKGVRIS